ncbi:MAG: hypothetical protein Ct9H300mP14_10130 [Gammaproteobacteria bacterium]|nr:MAG: hypothetical protein Ct9H300mP14_10130 [Gammaproteobacteria bacterium]
MTVHAGGGKMIKSWNVGEPAVRYSARYNRKSIKSFSARTVLTIYCQQPPVFMHRLHHFSVESNQCRIENASANSSR